MKRFALLLVFACCALRADTVTFAANSIDYCTTQPNCDSISSVFIFPQFNPALGVLNSISFSLTDNANILWGFSDLYSGVGTEYSGEFDYQLYSADQNLTYSAQLTTDFIASGPGHLISLGPHFEEPYTFTRSGTFALQSYYVGDSLTGTGFIFTGAVYGSGFGLVGLENSGELSVTYHYDAPSAPAVSAFDAIAPVPEPRGIWLVIGLIGALALWQRNNH